VITARNLTLLSALALAIASLGAVALRDTSHWDWSVLLVLTAVAIASDQIRTNAKGFRVSGGFLAIGIAMALLGPVPAAAINVLLTLVDGRRARSPRHWLVSNLAIAATYPLVAGLALYETARATGLAPRDISFALLVVGGYLLANFLNFVGAAGARALIEGGTVGGALRRLFLPLLPNELASGALAAGIVCAYARVGVVALGLLAMLVLLHQYLMGELLVSEERREELEQRMTQLASLHMGVMSAMLQTLSLRDKMTARHSAAVARYSRELAAAAGLDQTQQDLVHTAGLLHDIGKFIFPDHILLSSRRLSDEDWETIKRHPAQGAKVVRQVDGYGPVADIILCHHERMDGSGYPRNLPGDEIPVLSRIISIADTYDVMTARDSYRDPVSSAEAVAELQRVAGTQLDARLVELFVEMLAARGVAFRHADDADFQAELAFEKRVRAYVTA